MTAPRVPTEPGWWWRSVNGVAMPVRVQWHSLYPTEVVWFEPHRSQGVPVRDDGEWMSEVAPPDGVARLVAERDALAVALASLGERLDRHSAERAGSYRQGEADVLEAVVAWLRVATVAADARAAVNALADRVESGAWRGEH